MDAAVRFGCPREATVLGRPLNRRTSRPRMVTTLSIRLALIKGSRASPPCDLAGCSILHRLTLPQSADCWCTSWLEADRNSFCARLDEFGRQ
jgi:hypothetical protein